MSHSLPVSKTDAGPGRALSAKLVLGIFLPFSTGYYLSYLFRSINAVIAPDLVADAHLEAAELGFLTSVYFLTFALLQLPLGLALDRFGPRRVAALLLLVAAAGALVFSLAEGLPGLTLGRALIGAGVSACLMSSFKAFALWFPPQKLPVVNGVLLAVGGLGAISATLPVELLLAVIDWRMLFFGLALATAGSAVLVYCMVPEHHEAASHTGFADQLLGLGQVFRDAFFWRVAPLGAISSGASQTVLGLWAGPWLRDVAGFDRGEVASHLMIGACGMSAGFLLMGMLAERLSKIGIAPTRLVGFGMSAFMLMMLALAGGAGSGGLVWPLLLAFGFIATGSTINYALMSQHFGPLFAGRANTALNLLVFVVSFFMQWLFGAVLGFWESPPAAHYAAEGYRTAFAALASLQVLALYWFYGPGKRRAEHV